MGAQCLDKVRGPQALVEGLAFTEGLPFAWKDERERGCERGNGPQSCYSK